ncbi:NEDD4-binding protein 2-like 2 [Pelodytes ibericus]
MPHVKRYFSWSESTEPCLKNLKTEDCVSQTGRNALANTHNEDKTQPRGKDIFPFSYEEKPIKQSGNEATTVNKDFQSGTKGPCYADRFNLQSRTSTSSHGKDYGTSQNPLKGPSSETESTNNRSTTGTSADPFSETSKAFIGPLFPPPTVKNVPDGSCGKVGNNPGASHPCYKIKTVALGKASNRLKGTDGMDYEMRQFYRELHQLEEDTDHETINTKDKQCKVSDIVQKPVPATYPPNQEPLSQGDQHVLPRDNQASFDKHSTWREHNMAIRADIPPFSNPTMPPRFLGPPPPFFLPRGPPPAICNYPMTFPNQNMKPQVPYPLKPNPHGYNEEHQRQSSRHPWDKLHSPQNSRYSDEESSYTKLHQNERCRDEQLEEWGEDAFRPRESHSPRANRISSQQYLDKNKDSNMPCHDYKRKLVLLRGVPGSGKSTLARILLDLCPDGLVLSTDDYFCQREGYTYDVKLLGDAHNWNQNRAVQAMDDGRSPIIIDNTNIQAWEMKPYVQMAIGKSYFVEFLEPDTWWKTDPFELEKRNTHGVPREKISKMLDRYEHDVTMSFVMNSVEPPHRTAPRPLPPPRPRWGASVDISQQSSAFHSR